MTNAPIVLIVDDEATVRSIVSQYLRKEGYEVMEASDGGEALQMIHQTLPDLLVLDIMLPGIDGLTLMRSLRDPVSKEKDDIAEIPIILLTARSEENDRIAGFELGADDYVVKPFSPRELVMRVKALLRRTTSKPNNATTDKSILTYGELQLDPKAYTVTKNGQLIILSPKEFDLLYFMARHLRQVFTRNQLLDEIWGYDYYGDDSNVTVHIHRLREKLEDDPANPVYIQTVWGVGYKFEVPQ